MLIATLRDISVVLIAIQVFVILLIPGAVAYYAVRGTSWVLRQTRTYSPLVQAKFRQAAGIADKASQKVAAPLIGRRRLFRSRAAYAFCPLDSCTNEV